MTENFAGRDWWYDFREMNVEFSDSQCKTVASKLLERYSKQTKEWNPDLNSEWICRLYMAAKLVMSSTLQVNAMNFAADRNLRVVIPYLRYYSVLSLLRAICLTLPDLKWEKGELIQLSHKKAIQFALEHLQRFDRSVAAIAETEIRELKAERELISYRAPSIGDRMVTEKNRFLNLCTLLAEIAQFNSELLELSIEKHANPSHFSFSPEFAKVICSVKIDGHVFGDTEDSYRLAYVSRKNPFPVNIQRFMKEGHVDDFFGAWVSHEEQEQHFNPDEMQQILFDVP